MYAPTGAKITVGLDKVGVSHYNNWVYRGVAKFGIALGSGPRGLGFESRHSDQTYPGPQMWPGFFVCFIPMKGFSMSKFKVHIGLRTIKTAVAVIISMIIVDSYGATSSKLIFAMLGAMAAVMPTFRDSIESCLAQIIGVIFGGICGVVLQALPVPQLIATGIGIVLVITLYNTLKIRFSPSLPCFIVVMVCTTPDIAPIEYALGRIWDTAIGLGIGTLINTLVFPYDNSRQIRQTAESLDREVISFLENMFDGDDVLPDTTKILKELDKMEAQLRIFSNQKLIMRLKRQKEELESFRICERKSRELLARMEILCCVGHPGRLNMENINRLKACGANIPASQQPELLSEKDVVTNYHITQILNIRQELLEALGI